ncbi:hypothetical protein D3C79_943520 [compost metagenome]
MHQIAHQPFMSRKVSQHPAPAVEEHKYRQRFFYSGRPHQMQQDILPPNVNGLLADVDFVQRDFNAVLRPLQHFTRLLRLHLLHRFAAAGV